MERPFLKRCTPVTLHLEDQPQLQWEFQARLGYLKPCLKKACEQWVMVSVLFDASVAINDGMGTEQSET